MQARLCGQVPHFTPLEKTNNSDLKFRFWILFEIGNLIFEITKNPHPSPLPRGEGKRLPG